MGDKGAPDAAADSQDSGQLALKVRQPLDGLVHRRAGNLGGRFGKTEFARAAWQRLNHVQENHARANATFSVMTSFEHSEKSMGARIVFMMFALFWVERPRGRW
jgi:hypothetical protein